MAMHQINPQGGRLASLDPIWDRVRNEAEDIVRREPELASFIYSTVLHHDRLEDSVIHRLAERRGERICGSDRLRICGRRYWRSREVLRLGACLAGTCACHLGRR